MSEEPDEVASLIRSPIAISITQMFCSPKGYLRTTHRGRLAHLYGQGRPGRAEVLGDVLLCGSVRGVAQRTRFRTYQLGQERAEAALRDRQIWLMRNRAKTSPEEAHQLAWRILWTEVRRRGLLRELCPKMARNVLETLVGEPQAWRKLMVEHDGTGIDWEGPEEGTAGTDQAGHALDEDRPAPPG